MASVVIGSTVILVVFFIRMLFGHSTQVPIVALALFAAVSLSDKRSAFLLFFGGLLLGDLVLGFHRLVPVVYASLVPVLCIGFQLKKRLCAPKIAGATLLGSLIYFFLTNFGVWALGGCAWIEAPEFPPTAAGLVGAYAAALPDLPLRVLAELLGAALLFGALLTMDKSDLPSRRVVPAGSKGGLG